MDPLSSRFHSDMITPEQEECIVKLTTMQVNEESVSLEKAKEYDDIQSIRHMSSGHKSLQYPVCKTSLNTFGEYGDGLQLYFFFIKQSSYLFFFISLLSIYPLYSNYTGENFESTYQTQRYTYFTLANQGGVSMNETNLQAALDRISLTNGNLNRLWPADLLMNLIFLAFIVAYAYVSKKKQIIKKGSNLSLCDFSVVIRGFPPYITENQVAEHLESYGEINEIYLSRTYEGNLFRYRNLFKKAKKKYLRSAGSSQQLNHNLEVLTYDLEEKIKLEEAHAEMQVDKAFIVFSRINEKKTCLRYFQQTSRKTTCCKKRSLKATRRGSQFRLQVSEPPNPSDIKWENYEFSDLNVVKVRVPIAIFASLVILLSFLVIYGIKAYFSTIPSQNACTSLQVFGNLLLAEAKKLYTRSAQISCYCKQQKIDTLMSNSDLAEYCTSYIESITSTLALKLTISISIVLVNLLLKFIIHHLSRFERFRTITEKRQSLLVKMFILSFINTALSTFLVNVQKDSWNSYGDGKYLDISRLWYDDVGATITLTMIVSVFLPHCFELVVLYPLKKLRRKLCYKRFKSQYMLNQWYIGPSFEISDSLSQVLMVIFTNYMYSAGMPMLNLLCLATLVLTYWCNKCFILKYYRKPPVYSYEINEVVYKTLPFAVIIHSVFAIYAYGASDIFPIGYTQNSENDVVTPVPVTFVERIQRPAGIGNLVVIALSLCVFAFLT